MPNQDKSLKRKFRKEYFVCPKCKTSYHKNYLPLFAGLTLCPFCMNDREDYVKYILKIDQAKQEGLISFKNGIYIIQDEKFIETSKKSKIIKKN